MHVTEDITDDYNQHEATPVVGDERGYTKQAYNPRTGTRKQRHDQDVDDEPQDYGMQKLAAHCENSEGTLYRVRGIGYSGCQVKKSCNSSLQNIEREAKMLQQLTVKNKKTQRTEKVINNLKAPS